jgi:hypothetical protein
MDKLRKEFSSPSTTYRGAPFWSWNDRLDACELSRQVRDMQDHGMGGFFMHSREGLETEYMGPEWLECIRETVKTARETGMNAWLYDEDRWPSGFAGGLVAARGGDDFRAKVVTLEVHDHLPEGAADALAVYAACLDGKMLESYRRLRSGGDSARLGEVFLVLHREVGEASEWFNDDAYADNLNPDSVAAFLDITYEAYRKEVGHEFGKAIPGIFTDEPNIFHHRQESGRRALPWTDGLPALFADRRGYDLLDVLPWLFFDGRGAAKARHDYWYTISQRFTEAYSQQLGEWCERNNLAFTGHYLNESEMGYAILRGGAIMPHYRYQQVPGIDMLTEQNHEFITIKQCSSVANQFDRPRVLSETYGCSGWEFTFEGQKWNGDWQYVLGVNLRCQHLALYSLRGCRKRDYPPAFNYNTTWWKYNAVVEDYFARAGLLTSAGHAVRDVLVLHPVATGWAMLGEGEDSVNAVDAFGEKVNDFIQAVLAAHYDFDFGDEQIMAAVGSVEGDHLRVGRAPYRVVVIPPGTRTLFASTVSLMEKFLDAGGRLVAFDPLPEWIEGVPDEHLAALWSRPGVAVLDSSAGLNGTLEALLPRRVSLVTPQGQQAARLLAMQREINGRFAYFIVNNDRENAYTVEVGLEGGRNGMGRLEEWNPLTGEVRALPAAIRGGRLCFQAVFAPAGSRLYVIDPLGRPVDEAGEAFRQEERWSAAPGEKARFIGPACSFTRTDPNLLTLDICQWRRAGRGWSERMDVWRAQDDLRHQLGMRSIYYNGLPQRYRWALKPHAGDGAWVALRFTFTVKDVPSTPVDLLLESAGNFRISLNGQKQHNVSHGWYLDRAFDRVPLARLKPGENELVLSCAYTNVMELEDCFLLGDFGVSLGREIITEPDVLHFGEWTSQGYPHYAGSMVYHSELEFTPGKRVRVSLGECRAVDVAVQVNGKAAGNIPWRAANGLEITPLLVPGINRVDIEVVGSPRNMLGPLHRAPEHEPWTDWRSFRRTDETYTPEYVFWPWGLVGQVRLVEFD